MRAVPASLRLANQAHLIERLLRLGVATRAELAKATGMSQPTAGKIIDELLAAGVVEQLGPRNSRVVQGVGRPGKRLRLAREPARLVAIELGVERTRMAALPAAPLEQEHWTVEFKTPSSESAWQKRLEQHSAAISLRRPWGVVMSIPGVVDERAGKVLLCPNLHWVEKADLKAIVGRVFRGEVCLVQEIRALALGELGSRSPAGDFLLVDFGEGVGGAVVLGQRPYDGPLPSSGEIGHTPVLHNRRRCGCGNRGCLETLTSERGLLESFRGAGARGAKTGLLELCRYLGRGEFPSWLRDALDATAGAIGGALNTLGLGKVVLTGHIGDLGPKATEYLASAIRSSAMWSRFDTVEVGYAPRRRALGLTLAGIQRLVMTAGFGRDRSTGAKLKA